LKTLDFEHSCSLASPEGGDSLAAGRPLLAVSRFGPRQFYVARAMAKLAWCYSLRQTGPGSAVVPVFLCLSFIEFS
ncbi:hypothetical protein, partial [Comamonas composti]|uniref:hypothetical protein n=1 Tax=Comamonas composti TaxID=408558 RepID=UPI001B7FD5C5